MPRHPPRLADRFLTRRDRFRRGGMGFGLLVLGRRVHDPHATVLYLLGCDHERLTYRCARRDFRLSDVHGRVVKELLA